MTTTAKKAPVKKNVTPEPLPERWVATDFDKRTADGSPVEGAKRRKTMTKVDRRARADHYTLLLEAEVDAHKDDEFPDALLIAVAALLDDYRGGLPAGK